MAWLKWFAPERSRLREAGTDEVVARLRESVERAVRRSRRALVSVTTEVDVADPCAAVFASRLASDRWFCWEQPDREFALAGLGVAYAAASRGGGRFADIAEECLRTGRDAILDEPRGPAAGARARRSGLARRLRLRLRGRRLVTLVLAPSGLDGPAGALALLQR